MPVIIMIMRTPMIWTFDKSVALAAYFGNALSVLGGRQRFAGVTSEHERPRRVGRSSITLTAPAKNGLHLETPNSPCDNRIRNGCYHRINVTSQNITQAPRC